MKKAKMCGLLILLTMTITAVSFGQKTSVKKTLPQKLSEDKPASEKPNLLRVAVLQFETKGNVTMKDAGKITAEWMNSSIIKTGKYSVLERVLLKSVLEEQELSSSDLFDPTKSSKIGNLYGAQAIIFGSIIEWNHTYTLSARMIEVSTARVIGSAEYKSNNIQNFPQIMDKFAQVLAGQIPQSLLDQESSIPLQGGNKPMGSALTILKVKNTNGQDSVVLSGGLENGIKKGDWYKVYISRIEKSEITGELTVTGIDHVGYIEITYLESRLSLGKLIEFNGDKNLLVERGFVVPTMMMGGSLGILARNVDTSSMAYGLFYGIWTVKWEFDFAFYYSTASFPIWMDLILKYRLIGSSFTSFQISIGGGLGYGGGKKYPGTDQYGFSDNGNSLRVAFEPFIELYWHGLFIQGGASGYYDFMVSSTSNTDKRYGIFPFIRGGYSF